MRISVRSLLLPAVVAVAVLAGAGVGVRSRAGAFTPRVLLYDNDGTFAPGDAGTGMWGFTPAHMAVTKGETIEFVNPAGNARPHTVTSITWEGMAPTRTLTSGAKFDSSPTRESLIMPGTSFMLSTADLDPGNYVYYCTLHPWMVGTFTVTPAPMP